MSIAKLEEWVSLPTSNMQPILQLISERYYCPKGSTSMFWTWCRGMHILQKWLRVAARCSTTCLKAGKTNSRTQAEIEVQMQCDCQLCSCKSEALGHQDLHLWQCDLLSLASQHCSPWALTGTAELVRSTLKIGFSPLCMGCDDVVTTPAIA